MYIQLCYVQSPSCFLQAVGSKRSDVKTLEKKVRPMEDLFQKFRAWLSEIGTQLSSLSPPSPQDGERSKQLQQAKVRATLPLCVRVLLRDIFCHVSSKFHGSGGERTNTLHFFKACVNRPANNCM